MSPSKKAHATQRQTTRALIVRSYEFRIAEAAIHDSTQLVHSTKHQYRVPYARGVEKLVNQFVRGLIAYLGAALVNEGVVCMDMEVVVRLRYARADGRVQLILEISIVAVVMLEMHSSHH